MQSSCLMSAVFAICNKYETCPLHHRLGFVIITLICHRPPALSSPPCSLIVFLLCLHHTCSVVTTLLSHRLPALSPSHLLCRHALIVFLLCLHHTCSVVTLSSSSCSVSITPALSSRSTLSSFLCSVIITLLYRHPALLPSP